MKRAILLSSSDNVATALTDVFTGDNVCITDQSNSVISSLAAATDIPRGHKICIADIPNGCQVLKYGCVIGQASADIHIGELVREHNIESLRGRGDLS